MLICKNCQILLTGKHTKLFCSRSCSASYNNRIHKIKHGKYSPKPCEHCGKETKSPRFCSRTCMGLSKIIYKTDAERLHYKRMQNRESTARYAAKKKYQTPIGINLNEIKEFYQNCPPGHEVDHIIPISKGGPHTLENLQYLTISENRKKSNKILVPLTGI